MNKIKSKIIIYTTLLLLCLCSIIFCYSSLIDFTDSTPQYYYIEQAFHNVDSLDLNLNIHINNSKEQSLEFYTRAYLSKENRNLRANLSILKEQLTKNHLNDSFLKHSFVKTQVNSNTTLNDIEEAIVDYESGFLETFYESDPYNDKDNDTIFSYIVHRNNEYFSSGFFLNHNIFDLKRQNFTTYLKFRFYSYNERNIKVNIEYFGIYTHHFIIPNSIRFNIEPDIETPYAIYFTREDKIEEIIKQGLIIYGNTEFNNKENQKKLLSYTLFISFMISLLTFLITQLSNYKREKIDDKIVMDLETLKEFLDFEKENNIKNKDEIDNIKSYISDIGISVKNLDKNLNTKISELKKENSHIIKTNSADIKSELIDIKKKLNKKKHTSIKIKQFNPKSFVRTKKSRYK